MTSPIHHRPGDPRTEPRLESHAPTGLGWAMCIGLFTVFLAAVLAVVVRP